jgi:UDP-GlcNAc:undecaprenyl-phosphate/decaprenyl-phosphate GlcNAc-1-phosphate transferase
MFLGFGLAWFLIDLSQGGDQLIAPVTALWLFALPLFDTVSLMVRRVLRGRSPFSADREHFHHVLQAAGYGVTQSVLIMHGLALSLALVGLGGVYAGVPDWIMLYGFLGLFALYFGGMTHAWKVMKLIRRRHRSRAASSSSLGEELPEN